MWDLGLVDTDRVGNSYIYLHLTTCGTWDLLMQTELVIATVSVMQFYYIYLQDCGTWDLLA